MMINMESTIYNELKATFGDRLELDEYIDDDDKLQVELYLNVGNISINSGIVEVFSIPPDKKDTEIYFNQLNQACRSVITRHKESGITPNNIHNFIQSGKRFVKTKQL